MRHPPRRCARYTPTCNADAPTAVLIHRLPRHADATSHCSVADAPGTHSPAPMRRQQCHRTTCHADATSRCSVADAPTAVRRTACHVTPMRRAIAPSPMRRQRCHRTACHVTPMRRAIAPSPMRRQQCHRTTRRAHASGCLPTVPTRRTSSSVPRRPPRCDSNARAPASVQRRYAYCAYALAATSMLR